MPKLITYGEALRELNAQFEINNWDEEEDMKASDGVGIISRLFSVEPERVMQDASMARNGTDA